MTFKTPANNTVITPTAPAMGPKFGSLDNLGRLRTSRHQNIYEADFEYGTQPMRWENYVIGSNSSVTHVPGSGGVRMRLSNTAGDVTIRQTRPYHRYQPGKTMVMSTALNFGAAQTGQRQRVGFFDDGNGIFFEQGDPIPANVITTSTGNLISGNNIITGLTSTTGFFYGMPVSGYGITQVNVKTDPNGNIVIPNPAYVTQVINSTAVAISQAASNTTVANTYSFFTPANPYGMYTVVRSDVQSPSLIARGVSAGTPYDTRIPLPLWNGDNAAINSIDWTRIQMLWQEYTWYGAGMARWGVVINGEWVVLNYIGFGNLGPTNVSAFPSQQGPWSRTGNLPVRYEQRNLTATSTYNDMYHYGVSVVVEGGQDDQRGFTYSYGMSPATPRRTVPSSNTRYPVLSISSRPMAVIELSGNSSYNAPTSASTNASITIAANSTFDGVLLSSFTANLTISNSIVQIVSGNTANVAIGQSITNANIPANTYVVSVNSTAIIMSNTATASATGATVNTYTANYFAGRHIYFPSQGTKGLTARITSSNSTVITFGDIITGLPIANTASMTGTNYQIGLINRGQLLPKTMYISSDALCDVELITSTTTSPITLTSAVWATLANTTNTSTYAGSITQANIGTLQAGLGSNYSFAQRDVSATAMSGGEVVLGFVAPVGGSGLQTIDLSYFFPLYNTVTGATPDILTVAVTTGATAANVGVHIVGQEAMS